MMSPNINIMWLIGGVMLIMSPIDISAQEKTREDVLLTDIQQLGERAVRDNVITEDEHKDLDAFSRYRTIDIDMKMDLVKILEGVK